MKSLRKLRKKVTQKRRAFRKALFALNYAQAPDMAERLRRGLPILPPKFFK